MKRISIIGLCLVAVFALVAVAVGSASAQEPEWGRCIAQKKGYYTEGNCYTVAEKKGVPDHKGSYEWLGGAEPKCYAMKKGYYTESKCETVAGKTKKGVFTPDHKGSYEKESGGNHFTGVGGTGILDGVLKEGCETPSKEKLKYGRIPCVAPNKFEDTLYVSVECSSETNSGEATGLNGLANIKVTFRGCFLLETLPCHTEGAALDDEVVVNTLKGELGYIDKAKSEVGVLLEPATPKGTFVVLHCVNEAKGENTVATVGVGNATEGAAYQPEATGGNDGLISPITPVNAMTEKFEQKYTFVFERGIQSYNVPRKFEGGPIEELEMYDEAGEEYAKGETKGSSHWSEAGEEVTNVATTEGKVEIKA